MTQKGVTKAFLPDWETPEKLEDLYNYAKSGMINVEIARKMGVSESTLYVYLRKSEPIREAIARGKAEVDSDVVNAAFRNAMGYEFVEETEELVDGVMQVTKRVKKIAPPNATMQIYWMKNRLKNEWKDSQLTDEQKRKLQLENEILQKTLDKLDGKDMDTNMLDSLVNLFKKK